MKTQLTIKNTFENIDKSGLPNIVIQKGNLVWVKLPEGDDLDYMINSCHDNLENTTDKSQRLLRITEVPEGKKIHKQKDLPWNELENNGCSIVGYGYAQRSKEQNICIDYLKLIKKDGLDVKSVEILAEFGNRACNDVTLKEQYGNIDRVTIGGGDRTPDIYKKSSLANVIAESAIQSRNPRNSVGQYIIVESKTLQDVRIKIIHIMEKDIDLILKRLGDSEKERLYKRMANVIISTSESSDGLINEINKLALKSELLDYDAICCLVSMDALWAYQKCHYSCSDFNGLEAKRIKILTRCTI